MTLLRVFSVSRQKNSIELILLRYKDEVIPALIELSITQWRRMGERRHSFTILDLCTWWRWVVSFMHRQIYPQEKSPWYPLDRRLGGPAPEPVWTFLRRERSLDPAANRTPAVQHVARRYTDCRSVKIFEIKYTMYVFKMGLLDVQIKLQFGYDLVFLSYSKKYVHVKQGVRGRSKYTSSSLALDK
jgi:hypothetical protein